ncbi:MAG: FtsW/RodA/SpoVE family cell cycle protein [Clostridium sp.]
MKKKKGNIDYILLIVAIILFAIGIVTLLSASAPESLKETGNSYVYFKKQMLFTMIGVVSALLISIIDYRVFKNIKLLMFGYLSMLAIAISVKFLGISEGGAARWIQIGGFSLQPSEFIKIGMIAVMAGYLSNLEEKNQLKNPTKGVLIPLALITIMAGSIFVFQNHLSAAILIFATGFIQMIIAGVDFKSLFTYGVVGTALSSLIIFKKLQSGTGGFRQARLQVWLKPFEYIKTTGWQTSQGLYALASGGIFGVGIGNSKQKNSYIPEPQNDFIFAIYSEEVGFIGVVLVIILFLVLISRGLLIANNVKDLFGKLIAVGITSILGLQVIGNLAVVSNTIPVTGISLPLFSYGGSSIISVLILLGLLLNISKHTND